MAILKVSEAKCTIIDNDGNKKPCFFNEWCKQYVDKDIEVDTCMCGKPTNE